MYKYEDSDQIWIRKARRGDAKAFACLYGRIYQDLYRFALYMMKHPQDAEDMVSEAVVAAYENIGKLKKEEAFGSWMFRILSNCCKKKLAANQKALEFTGERTLPGETEALAPALEVDYAGNRDVWDAFQKLTEEERLIIGLSIFGGYKSVEIGAMLELKPVTVRSKQSRAFQKMRESLGKECFL